MHVEYRALAIISVAWTNTEERLITMKSEDSYRINWYQVAVAGQYRPLSSPLVNSEYKSVATGSIQSRKQNQDHDQILGTFQGLI